MPHIAPKKYAQNNVVPGVAAIDAHTSGTSREASVRGAMIQLKKPPTSQ